MLLDEFAGLFAAAIGQAARKYKTFPSEFLAFQFAFFSRWAYPRLDKVS